MKKLAIIFIFWLASFHFAHAATTPLVESLLEYNAITNFIGAPNFTTIGPNEFIIDIRRITQRVNISGTIEYSICTRLAAAAMDQDIGNDAHNNPSPIDHNHGNDGVHKHYVATLTVIPNPGIGPNIVTVNSIVECD